MKNHARMHFHILTALIAVVISGCASGTLYVNTGQDEVEVFVRQGNATKATSIGTTPLQTPTKGVVTKSGVKSGLVLELRKEGFLTKEIYLPDLGGANKIEIRTSLTPEPKPEAVEGEKEEEARSPAAIEAELMGKLQEKVNRTEETNQLFDQVFEIKRLISTGQMQDAEGRIDTLKQTYPDLSILYEMRGGIAFMNKDYQRALEEYTLALQVHPENLQVLNMKRYLERVLNQGGGQ